MSGLTALLGTKLGLALVSYIGTKLGGRLVERFGGTLWGKLIGLVFSRFIAPSKTDAELLIEKLTTGDGLTQEQRDRLTPDELALIDHE